MNDGEAYCARCFIVQPKGKMVRKATGDEMDPRTNHWFICVEVCDEFKRRQREEREREAGRAGAVVDGE